MEKLKQADKILTRFEKLLRAHRYIINYEEIEAYQEASKAYNNGEVDEKNLKIVCNTIYDCTEEKYSI